MSAVLVLVALLTLQCGMLFPGSLYTADGVAAGSASALVIVAKNGTDAPGCGSASSPCLTVGYAVLNASQPTDVISILPGIYLEQPINVSGPRNLTIQVRLASLVVILSTEYSSRLGSRCICGLTAMYGKCASVLELYRMRQPDTRWPPIHRLSRRSKLFHFIRPRALRGSDCVSPCHIGRLREQLCGE